MIPLRVKIIQLLLREYMIVQEEEKMAQEGGEDEGEDDEDVSKQIHIHLSKAISIYLLLMTSHLINLYCFHLKEDEWDDLDGLEDEGFLSSVLGTNGSTFVDASLFFPQDDDWDEDDIDEIEAKKDPIYHIDVKVGCLTFSSFPK